MAALILVQIQWTSNQKVSYYNEKHELVKRKVFRAACLMTIDSEFGNNLVAVNTILSSFSDESKKSDEKSWLPLHFAIALSSQNRISGEDVHMMDTIDPLAMYRMCGNNWCDNGDTSIGCTPAHLLCMQQKNPNMSLVRYFCVCDLKAFFLCDQNGRCALHLIAQYSESVELLQTVLYIDRVMTKRVFDDTSGYDVNPLGLLCRRIYIYIYVYKYTYIYSSHVYMNIYIHHKYM
jgi:hypothetical protein